MRNVLSRNWEGLSSPGGAYASARELAEKAVSLQMMNTGGKTGLAISELSQRAGFGSWLRKLFHGEKVSIHLHYYERLVGVVEDLNARQRKQIEDVQKMTERAKRGRYAANMGSSYLHLTEDDSALGIGEVSVGL